MGRSAARAHAEARPLSRSLNEHALGEPGANGTDGGGAVARRVEPKETGLLPGPPGPSPHAVRPGRATGILPIGRAAPPPVGIAGRCGKVGLWCAPRTPPPQTAATACRTRPPRAGTGGIRPIAAQGRPGHGRERATSQAVRISARLTAPRGGPRPHQSPGFRSVTRPRVAKHRAKTPRVYGARRFSSSIRGDRLEPGLPDAPVLRAVGAA
mmetsp:Transcript_28230/g.78962  ORF Transcript_28230/g.78962 Transcript_28230/m.78962 type:complete len:211 (+) Transcript_28230:770-1402(+)